MLRVRIIAALCYLLPCSLTKDPALAGFLSMMRPSFCTRMAFNINAHYANLKDRKGRAATRRA